MSVSGQQPQKVANAEIPRETTVLALEAVADLIDEAQRIIAPVINAPPSSDAAEPPRP